MFGNCSALGKLIIPDSVGEIRDHAFKDCANLAHIHLPSSLQVLEDGIFEGCTSLEKIEIPGSVRKIGSDVFLGCDKISEIFLPDSLEEIDPGLGRCANLDILRVSENNPKFDSRDNCNAIIETATGTLVYGFEKSTIPNSVKIVGPNAFSRCASLTDVQIPSSVTLIGQVLIFWPIS